MFPTVLLTEISQPANVTGLQTLPANWTAVPPGYIPIQPAAMWALVGTLALLLALVSHMAVFAGRLLWRRNKIRIFWRGEAAHSLKEEWVKRMGEEFTKKFGPRDGQVILQAEAMYRDNRGTPTWFIDQTTGLPYVFETNASRYEKNPALEIAAQSNPLVYHEQITKNRARHVWEADRDDEPWYAKLMIPAMGLLLIMAGGIAFLVFHH